MNNNTVTKRMEKNIKSDLKIFEKVILMEARIREIISDIWNDFKSLLKYGMEIRPDLQSKVEELEAREKIREVIAIYTYCWNSKDVEGILRIMTDDCEIVHGYPYKGVWKGKGEAREFFEGILKTAHERGLRLLNQEDKHYVTNVVIRIDKDMRHAKAHAYFLRASFGWKGNEEMAVISSGWYFFTIRREGEEWKIMQMRIERCFESEPFKVKQYLL